MINDDGNNNELRSHHFSAILPLAPNMASMSATELVALTKSAVAEAELTAVAEATANFQPQGASAVVVLEESHIAIHLWPEKGVATVDIHVCDYSGDNESKAEHLAQIVANQLSRSDKLYKWSRLTVSSNPFKYEPR